MLAAHAASNAAATMISASTNSTSDIRKGLVDLKAELFGRALRMARSHSAAEDLVQDTVERAIRFERTYRPGTNLRAWVNQILFSVFVSSCRRRRCERDALDELAADPCAWTLPETTNAEVRTLSPHMARALKRLPTSFRVAVILVDIQEMSYKNAAARLGIPVGTVMSRLHRGRNMLGQALRRVRRIRRNRRTSVTLATAA